MNIQTKTIKTEIEKEVKIAVYSAEDIKKLIANDIEKNGDKVSLSDISFATNWKYVSDEWGMNAHMVAVFEGAEAKVNNS